MNRTKIEWTDYSWSPITGCSRNCSYCYGRRMAKRFGRSYEPTFHQERLGEPAKVKKPSRIFVGSVSDIMDPLFTRRNIEDIIHVALRCKHHAFQFLTKCPERLADFNPWPDNCWVGATATDQDMADEACRALYDVKAKVRFLSCEPLLKPIWFGVRGDLRARSFEWLIVGAMTGAKPKLPIKRAFPDIVSNAEHHHIPAFVKDKVPWTGPRPQEMPR